MGCTACEFHKTCRRVNIAPDGSGDIVFMGEAPGAEEDIQGRPFVGASGQLLRRMLSDLEIPPSRIRFTNAVRCRPPNNAEPKAKHIKACLPNLADEFLSKPPSIIVALGATPLKSLRSAGMLDNDGSITALHGNAIEQDGYIVFPMLHPAYILRNPGAMGDYVEALNKLEKIVGAGGLPKKKEVRYEMSNSVEDLKTALKTAKAAQIVSYDIETGSLHPQSRWAKFLTFALSWEERQGFSFSLDDSNRAEAIELLDDFLEDADVLKIIQNAKFELMWSMARGRTIKNMADVMLMHWHVDERNKTHNLGALALKYTDMGFYDKELEDYKKDHPEADPEKVYMDEELGEERPGSYGNIPLKILMPYNCMDTDATIRVYNKLGPQLNERQRRIHDEIQIPSSYPLAEMELRGIRIDWEYASKLDIELPQRAEEVAKKILAFPEVQKCAENKKLFKKKELNLNSTHDLSDILFKYLNLPVVYRTKTGLPCTDANVLEYLANKHEIPKMIVEHRHLKKMHSTYVRSAFERRDGEVIHTSYGMAHTVTGRLNSTNPNLQNVPRDSYLKNMFIADKDEWLVQMDYSQIELRILALVSKDAALLDYFRSGEDVHRMIAAKILNKGPKEVTKEERTKAKRTVFGICYGQGEQGMADELGISLAEAKSFLAAFFKQFRSVKTFMDRTEEIIRRTGQVESMFGRVRRLPEALSADTFSSAYQEARRQGINQQIQTTAGDVLYERMAVLWSWMKEEIPQARMLLTVHDNLVFSVKEEDLGFFIPSAKLILEDLSEIPWVTIPVCVDVEIGRRWGDLTSFSIEDIAAIEEGKSVDSIIESKRKEESHG